MTNTSFWAGLSQALTNTDYGSTDSAESPFDDPYWGVPVDGYRDASADSNAFDEWMAPEPLPPEPLLRDETDYSQFVDDYLDQGVEDVDRLIGAGYLSPVLDSDRDVLPERLRGFATSQGSLDFLQQFDWDAELLPGQPMRDVGVGAQDAYDFFDFGLIFTALLSAAAGRGTTTSRTPFSHVASTSPASAPFGIAIEREKDPTRRSRRT